MAANDRASAQPPPTSYVELGGAHLAYSETGDGAPVIYAHGLTQSRDANRRAEMLEFMPVAATHRLIAYDARAR
jgi:pimeloyl-ACP methyl ester carboxylesterase